MHGGNNTPCLHFNHVKPRNQPIQENLRHVCIIDRSVILVGSDVGGSNQYSMNGLTIEHVIT